MHLLRLTLELGGEVKYDDVLVCIVFVYCILMLLRLVYIYIRYVLCIYNVFICIICQICIYMYIYMLHMFLHSHISIYTCRLHI